MNNRKIAILAGISYLIIFGTAIFANFFVLEAMLQAPLATVQEHQLMVRLGVMAFLVAAIFDVIVAWALYELYKKHSLTTPSTYFRIIHAVIMGLAVFALLAALSAKTDQAVLGQVDTFNDIWLIALVFFGVHLIFLGNIIKKPKWITGLLILAGVMYIGDTSAHFMMPNYNDYADIFLAIVAIPSILGEMSFTIWLLAKGGKENQ